MASPISFGDVVKALELCAWLKRNCFNHINNASVLYAGFRDDVLHLENRIAQFQASFEDALDQLHRDESQIGLLKYEAETLVGDFHATVYECKQLLRRHARFDGDRATALDNLFWHTTSQPDVEDLRKRLQLHSYKIYLIIEPLQLELVAGIAADAQEILSLLRRHMGLEQAIRLPEIPSKLVTAFESAVRRDPPIPFEYLNDLPLAEGVDALSLHYRECTFQSTSHGIDRDISQTLSLLKAHWLFKTIESSRTFRTSRRSSLFRRIVEQVGQGVETQYKALDIDAWDEDEFTGLDDAAFAIWPVKEVPKPPVLTDPVNREEKIAEVPLVCPYPDQTECLFIFRVNENVLRTVRSRGTHDGPCEMTERFVNLQDDGLVPLYAIAAGDSGRFALNLTNGKGGGTVAYEFASHKSAREVQAAFTGFDVMSSSSNVSCAITTRRNFGRDMQDTGRGQVQIWQRSQTGLQGPWPAKLGSTSSEPDSFVTGSSHTKVSQAFRMFDKDVLTVRDTDKGGQIISSELPDPPLLVLLVVAKSRYSLWWVDMSQLEIQTKNRRSSRQNRVILASKAASFTVRRLAVDESQLDRWNICATTTRQSSGQKGKESPSVEKLKATSIAIDFETQQKQDRFQMHFEVVASDRLRQIEQSNLGRTVAESQAQMPVRRQSYAQGDSRRMSASSVALKAWPRVGSAAPQLPSINRLTVLEMEETDQAEVVEAYK